MRLRPEAAATIRPEAVTRVDWAWAKDGEREREREQKRNRGRRERKDPSA